MDSLTHLGEGRELKNTSFEDRPEGLEERSGDLEERLDSLGERPDSLGERPERVQASRTKKGSCLSCQMFYNGERLKTTWTY